MNNKTETPLLPPSLSYIYGSLDSNMQRLFIKIFRWCWTHAINKRSYLRRGSALFHYWSIDISRMRLGLTTAEMCLLSYLYQVTNQGSNYIHSEKVYNSMVLPNLMKDSKLAVLKTLKKRGYVTRSYRNLSDSPYMARSFNHHPVFINLTSSGVQIIKAVEEDIYDIVYRHSMNDITGVNKKPDLLNQS